MMPAKKNISPPPNPEDYIHCPLNLDSLIMSPTITPNILERNCELADNNILYDAIRLSTCAYWMFKLDVLGQFSPKFRQRLYTCVPSLAKITRMYFNYQMDSATTPLKKEYDRFLLETGWLGGDPLNNPLTMLGNNIKEYDMMVLQGKMSTRQMLLSRIQEFLTTKDKIKIDFSYSLFLPEFLNPKFFQELSEAEHIVLVGNLSKYFEFLSKFNKTSFRMRRPYTAIRTGIELHPPQLLIKHILADEKNIYTNRVKMMAWNQLCQELDKLVKTSVSGWTYKLFNPEKVEHIWNENYEKLYKKGLSTLMVDEWLNSAEGVFESFELDCTLHNVDATDFLIEIMTDMEFCKMARGLMDFQDSETRNKLFKVVADAMTEFR